MPGNAKFYPKIISLFIFQISEINFNIQVKINFWVEVVESCIRRNFVFIKTVFFLDLCQGHPLPQIYFQQYLFFLLIYQNYIN